MKLPLKYIAILVILSLAGIFSYQAYWLGGLYRTMRNDLERNIIEAMRMSDYNEMMIRVDKAAYGQYRPRGQSAYPPASRKTTTQTKPMYTAPPP